MNLSRTNFLPFKFPSPKFRVVYFRCWTPNLKMTPLFPPPTCNPWNGLNSDCRQTKTRMNQYYYYNKSAPRLDRLFPSSALTGGSTDSFDQRGCLPRKHYSNRFDSRSNKEKNLRKQPMKRMKDSPIPRKRKNKFPVAVPWIFPGVTKKWCL